MGQLTGQPQYCQKAIAAVDAQVSAAESAIAAGSRPAVAGDSYLEVGPMIADVALTYDWCFDTVTSSQKQRWLAYANQAVWNVWHPSQAKWGSTAASRGRAGRPTIRATTTTTRSCGRRCCSASPRRARIPTATPGSTEFRQTKVLDQLVPTFDTDLVGGGSREGTGYGTAMMNLWGLYDFWKSTTGEGIGGKTPHTCASMRAMIHQIVPTLDRFAPTGDQSRDSTASMFDYQRYYLEELIRLYPTIRDGGPGPDAARAAAACR